MTRVTQVPPRSAIHAPSKGNLFTRQPVRTAATRQALPGNALRRLFWLAAAGLIAIIGLKAPHQTPESVIGALLIVVAAMIPSYIWVRGKVRGLPLFPVSALPCVWAFALPLVSEHPIVELFPGRNQLVAALSVSGYLILGTLAWYFVSRRRSRTPQTGWMLNETQCEPLLLIVLALCAFWTISSTAGWIRLSSGVDSLTSAILNAVEALTCFVLSYRLGCRTLTGHSKTVFLVLLSILLLANLPPLLLISAMSLSGVALLAYVTASKRLPWRVGLVALCAFGFLHIGKSEMREKYWHEDGAPPTQPLEYPKFLAEWVMTSLDVAQNWDAQDEHGESLLERASLMHWLLYIQANTPGAIPYMDGATYAVIPRLFIPRILDPDKPHSHEATYLISIQYGIQTREDTESTTIAFGLVNEAYANFGFLGMGGLGIVLGTFYAAVANWARGMPILSFRALFAILVASYSFQAEFTSTVYAAALFQSTTVLLVLGVVFMRSGQVNNAGASLLD